jgi:hypothetical protein
MDTSLGRVAGIVGADIVVIATSCHGGNALPPVTVVVYGAQVTIIAIAGIGQEGASHGGGAAIVGARIVIAAGQGVAANAETVVALVFHCADISIGAELDVGTVQTAEG